MPISLLWIRNHPDQVQEWQKSRGLDNHTALEKAISLDLQVRSFMHEIQLQRRRLNQVSKELKDSQDRERLLQERRELQLQLVETEKELALTRNALQRALWTLGSPVDDSSQVLEQLETYHQMMLPGVQDEFLYKWHLARDMMNFAYHFLGRKYSRNHPLPSQPELDLWQRNHLDLLHAMWGCCQEQDSNNNQSSACAICAMSEQDNNSFTTAPTDAIASTSRHPPPAWLTWMAQSIPRKSIFGAKQLPRYTLLRGSTALDAPNSSTSKKQPPSVTIISEETIELLAMTAGTTWDSRQVQMELAHELVALYQCLITDPEAVTFSLQAVPAQDLELHEQSRVMVVATSTTTNTTAAATDTSSIKTCTNTYPLGWVSNFGDSASRACDLYFKGGGLQDSKDNVHWVHATIVGHNTISNLIRCNVCKDKVLIPTCCEGALAMHSQETAQASLSLQSFRPPKTKDIMMPARKDDDCSPRLVAIAPKQQESITAKSKLTLFGVHGSSSGARGCTKESLSAESLTCPFGFLIDQ